MTDTAVRHDPSAHATSAPRQSRAWALAGVGAGLTGVASIVASTSIDAVYREETAGDAAAVVDVLSTQTTNIVVFHTLTMLTVALLPVFAAGLRRRLAAQGPAGGILPDVAFGGLLLTAVAGLMGAGLDTEFLFGVSDPEQVVPESGAFYAHWVGTIPWLWVGAGLAGVALAVASLRHGAAPRWIGWVATVLGGLTLLLGISPLQYMAGFTGPLFLLVAASGFAFGDRR